MSTEIQRVIDERMNVESENERIESFKKSIVAISENGRKFCSLHDLIRLEQMKADNPAMKQFSFPQQQLAIAEEAGSHIRSFLQIAEEHNIEPDERLGWDLRFREEKKFLRKESHPYYAKSIGMWTVEHYRTNYEGHASSRTFQLTENGLIGVNQVPFKDFDWIPDMNQQDVLIRSLADIVIRAGVTKVT